MITYKNLTVIPSYHSNLDFVQEARKAFYKNPPDVIAVEFPKNLKINILKGVNRLPKVSIVIYYDKFLKKQLFIPIDGSDSMIEVLRLSKEYGIPAKFIDLFVKNYEPEILSMPDSYTLTELSLSDVYNIINNQLGLEERARRQYKKRREKRKQEKDLQREEEELLESESTFHTTTGKEAEMWASDAEETDNLRDHYMAYRLKRLMEQYDQVLVVLGLKHWPHIKVILEEDDLSEEVFGFETGVNINCFNVLEKDLPKTMVETPNLIYQWENFRERQQKAINSLEISGEKEKESGESKEEEKRQETSSEILKSRNQYYSAGKTNRHNDVQKIPNNINLVRFDQFEAIKQIYKQSVSQYEEEYKTKINLHKLKSIFQFLRNLPLIDGMIRPTLYDIVLAAKSIINDDFAWIVWEQCKSYPDAEEDWDIDSLNFTDKGIFLHGRYFKIRRHVPVKVRKIKLPLKPKPKEKKKGEWKKVWNMGKWGICSYVPEDLFEENYFQHVRLRSRQILKDQMIRTHEFKSSLMDGIDFRETIKRWPYSDHKIFVKEQRKIRGDIDAVVIVFDKDKTKKGKEEKYPNTMMWYAEHHNESDLAIYSTPPGEVLVGPGISRVELGGVVSFFPPRSVPDIWSENFVKDRPFIKHKYQRLLMAAIIYAQKKYITYVANHPPDPLFRSFAHKLGNEIIYIPLDRFNPQSRHALRNIHMLAGKHVRDYAHRYIKKRRY